MKYSTFENYTFSLWRSFKNFLAGLQGFRDTVQKSQNVDCTNRALSAANTRLQRLPHQRYSSSAAAQANDVIRRQPYAPAPLPYYTFNLLQQQQLQVGLTAITACDRSACAPAVFAGLLLFTTQQLRKRENVHHRSSAEGVGEED